MSSGPKAIILSVSLVCLGCGLAAQSTPLVLLAEVPEVGTVSLRWAPPHEGDFAAAAPAGYEVVRTPLAADGTPAGAADVLALVRPEPATRWAARTDTSVFAGALYGVLYEPERAADDVEARQMGYDFALFAAEHDFGAARAAALAYRDTAVDPTRAYRYTVRAAATGFAARLTAAVDVDAAQITERPRPASLEHQRRANGLLLSWDRAAGDDHYVSYTVERRGEPSSEPGRTIDTTWTVLNARPLLQLLPDSADDDGRQRFRDTTAVPDLTYSYRVRGATSFGHPGPPSRPYRVAAEPPLQPAPRLTGMTQLADTLHRIAWSTVTGDATSVRLLIRLGPFDEYRPLTEPLPPADSVALVTVRSDGAYLAVEVTDTSGRRRLGPASILRVFDQTPPAPPTGLSGVMDTSGQVTLSWAPSPEGDVSGYRVYVGTGPRGYFPQVTRREVADTSYVTLLDTSTRAERAYFQVKAIDFTGNYSAPSATLAVERPDLYPPTPPVVGQVRASARGVSVPFAPSGSADVLGYVLERRGDDRGVGAADDNWEIVDTLGAEASMTVDTTGAAGELYEYRVVAVDDAGLTSASSTFRAGRTDDGLRADVGGFGVVIPSGGTTPTLTWTYPRGTPLRGFQVYRGEGAELDSPAALAFVTLASPGLRMLGGRFYLPDHDAEPGTTYTYRLAAVHHDGGRSPLTPSVTLTRPSR